MLIEVKEDIISRAIANRNETPNNAALFLTELSIAIKRGKHIVYVPSLKDNIELSDDLQKTVGRNVVILLKSSQRDRMKFNSILKNLNTKAVCSYYPLGREENWSRIIHIDPSKMAGFEISAETFIIGENILDIRVFDIMSDYFAFSKRIKNHYRSFYPLMGGGGTTYRVFENECKRKNHFCLVITDSDFLMPCSNRNELESFADNSTPKKVLEIYQRYNSKVGEFYPMRYVAEIENLIPTKILKNIYSDAKHMIVLNHDFAFYDMKKGLDYYRLRNTEVYDYWKSTYSRDMDFTEFDELSLKHKSFDDFKVAAKGKCLLPGWGKDILTTIIDNNEYAKMLQNIQRNDLQEYQHKEWLKIGELMFNWTCALEPRHV